MTPSEILSRYNLLKKAFHGNENSDEVLDHVTRIYKSSVEYLSTLQRVELASKIKGKRYFSFNDGGKISRAVNNGLFINDTSSISAFFEALRNSCFKRYTPQELTRACYTIAIAFCCVVDVYKTGDKKTPGTFLSI